jgi:hypothetical protein
MGQTHLNKLLYINQLIKGKESMKNNESTPDRIIRVILGLVLLALYLVDIVGGTLGIILVVLGAILLSTGIIGFCALLKFKTKKG